ncbi:MAG: nitroreductase [Acidobacteriota bacterium]|nr:nitroreductase [Acidobacteriota bacterium]
MTSDINTEAQIILDAIRNRRTMPFMKVKPDPIAEEHLSLILEAANWAPSHRHTEPWRFVIFQGEGRARLGDLLAETYKAAAGDKFLERKYQKSRNRCAHVPVAMAILMKPKGVNPEFEEILAVGCAVQNMHLAAQSLGIGCSWSTPALVDHPDVRTFFQLEEGERCLGFYYMGYAADPFPPSKRGDVNDKVTFIDHA